MLFTLKKTTKGPSWPDQKHRIGRNGRKCGIFQLPQYHPRQVILGLDK